MPTSEPTLFPQTQSPHPLSEPEFLRDYTPWRPASRKGGDRRATRHDGWTPERQGLFLCTLRYRRSVTLAARAVGLSRENAYQLRRKWPPFGVHWDRALSTDACTVADLLLRRVVDGVDVPVVGRGGVVRWKRVRPVDPGLWLLQQLGVVGPEGPRLRTEVRGPSAWDGTGLVAALVGRGRGAW